LTSQIFVVGYFMTLVVTNRGIKAGWPDITRDPAYKGYTV